MYDGGDQEKTPVSLGEHASIGNIEISQGVLSTANSLEMPANVYGTGNDACAQ